MASFLPLWLVESQDSTAFIITNDALANTRE